jgi:hypothetical protein
MATIVRPWAIARIPGGGGNCEDGRLNARSGTIVSPAVRCIRRAASFLLLWSRYDRYWAMRSAADRKKRDVIEVILQAPTLAMVKGTRAIRAKTAHLKSVNGCPQGPPHSSSS